MRNALLLVVGMTANIFALEQAELLPLIKEASQKNGDVYVKARDKIVGYGTNAIPILGTVAVNETFSWQERLTARICYERIERKEDIEKLLAIDWYNHPDFDPSWNEFITGPEGCMALIVTPEMKKAGLWYYYLEREWKLLGEDGKIRKNRLNPWVGCCSLAIKDNQEERIWFLRICADLMGAIPQPPRIGWLQTTLSREGKPDSDFVLEHRMPPSVPEPPFRLGTNIIKRAKTEL